MDFSLTLTFQYVMINKYLSSGNDQGMEKYSKIFELFRNSWKPLEFFGIHLNPLESLGILKLGQTISNDF